VAAWEVGSDCAIFETYCESTPCHIAFVAESSPFLRSSAFMTGSSSTSALKPPNKGSTIPGMSDTFCMSKKIIAVRRPPSARKYAASDLRLRIVLSRSFGNEASFMARLPSSVGIVILSIIRILVSLRISSAGYYAKQGAG
jgi:hypothetical protein